MSLVRLSGTLSYQFYIYNLILHVLQTNYKINFTIFHFIFAFLKIDFFSKYYSTNTFSQNKPLFAVNHLPVSSQTDIHNLLRCLLNPSLNIKIQEKAGCFSPPFSCIRFSDHTISAVCFIWFYLSVLFLFRFLCFHISAGFLTADKFVSFFHHIFTAFRTSL